MDKTTTPVSETGHCAWTTYWRETRRPVVSLAFVVPMLIVYELGIIVLGPQAMRNGADVWLRQFLDLIGFGQYCLLPILTIFALLAWHHMTCDPWRFSPRHLSGMFLESAALGFGLLLLAQVQGKLMQSVVASPVSAQMIEGLEPDLLSRVIGYFGAGIYEELLFRLMMIPPLVGLIRCAGGSRRISLTVAILVTSLLFSMAHYALFTSAGESFAWFSFSFRLIAGIFFAVLFTLRGFGIAAGTHALYDIFVAMS